MEQNTYYFVGIKGTGMASLARILHDKGHQVLGSDIEKETFTSASAFLLCTVDRDAVLGLVYTRMPKALSLPARH